MSTNNFFNHENGIFILPEHEWEEIEEMLLEEHEPEEVTDQLISSEIDFQNESLYECWLDNFAYELEEKGYGYKMINPYMCKVYNKQDKLLAELEVHGGYYSGAQVIVETDPVNLLDGYYSTQSELLEQYTPNHKRLLKLVSQYTTPLVKVGQFSNGEAVYEKV